MTAPVPGSFGQELVDAFEPHLEEDETYDWAGTAYLGAIGATTDAIRDLARHDGTFPGWAKVMDPDEVPYAYLPWLAQFVGVILNRTLSDADQRSQLKTRLRWQRGTIAAMRYEAEQTLTGNQDAIFFERVGGNAYALTVVTYTAETPDAAATEAALLKWKPAGITLTHNVETGQTWAQLKAAYATWALVKSGYTAWEDVANDT